MSISSNVNSKDKIFARDKVFWDNYLKGRPQAPENFFNRIFNYHQEHSVVFGIVHDVGAGNGPYAQKLRSRFQHVIVSDIVEENVRLAEERLGTDGFTYRVAKLEETDDILNGSVDLVFATNVLHFPDQQLVTAAIAKQLKAGGTFVGAGFGPATFDDAHVQELWARLMHQGGRVFLKRADKPEQTITVMSRSRDEYNVAPLDEKFFLPRAKRIHLNMEKGGLTSLLPPEDLGKVTEPTHTGVDDVVSFEKEEGWNFEADLNWIKEHFGIFPVAGLDPTAFTELWQEFEDLFRDGKTVKGRFPAKIILATRR
ncbi:S-adenosyl-L-methionine-dependent methyltransferase [Mollisia scopiformis]|uniref:S-adenosyl-L-methionine-dependent methyltransferase n=1 Tax=Mollisia scopiformis TaxID=149040 RepID=A0A194X162_MOLSC|nr:S-adenosyl-L-methionine-dependent methyltransferase [Mollisia scopiformis]KUJ13602.1 S-adenosyl-L-methionine-dependent methyltransferase [Mollisia scopiformis]